MPALSFPPELLLRAQGSGPRIGLRAAIFDVDGVLTDGRLWIGDSGETVKAFHALDGHGLILLMKVGITPIIITGRDSPAVRRRVQDLNLPLARYGVRDKLAVAEELLAELKIGWHELAAMGDDWPDLPLLSRVALAVAPPTAHAEVRALVHHVTQAPAGLGAAREYCDLLLMAGGHYADLLERQLPTLDAR